MGLTGRCALRHARRLSQPWAARVRVERSNLLTGMERAKDASQGASLALDRPLEAASGHEPASRCGEGGHALDRDPSAVQDLA